jgi:hypothetical protein
MTKSIKKNIILILILIILSALSIFLIYKTYNFWIYLNNWYINVWSWNITTGENHTWNNELLWTQKIQLISNKLFRNEKSFSTSLFPKIKINRMPQNIKLIANIDFAQEFKQYEYTKSDWYGFAIRFFIDSINNWWFYNVFRKTNWAVWNDYSRWLTWWILWKDINWWFEWQIPLYQNIPIAVNTENVALGNQFTYINPYNYLSNNLWKDIVIGVYLSSVKEFPWRKIMLIKELSLEYEWYKNDIEIIK